MDDYNTPNVVLPLVPSYDTRGKDAATNLLTSGLDQRKINVIYEPVMNSMTGKRTLRVARRPGATIATESFGAATQVAYLISAVPNLSANFVTASNHWVFSTDGNDCRASSSTTTTVIVTAAGYAPTFVDRTSISGTGNVVVQLRNASAAQTVWYSTAIGTFTQISDANFTGLSVRGKMEFVDGYAFILDSRGRIYNSDINTLATWGATSYLTRSIQQDSQVGLMRLGNRIIALGAFTMEVFGNAGNPTGSPLSRVQGEQQRIGLGADTVAGRTHYYAILDGKLFFHGQRAGPKGDGAYVFDGENVEKISNVAVDRIFNTTTVYSVFRIAFAGQVGVAFGLDLPTATTQRSLVFFPDWKEWFEWTSTVFKPVGTRYYLLGVGTNQNRIYNLTESATVNDNGTNFTSTIQFKLPSEGRNRKVMNWAGVTGDTARSAQSLDVEFSDDDGQNWSTARGIDMTQKIKQIYRCGSYSDRWVRLSYGGGAVDFRLDNFIARVG